MAFVVVHAWLGIVGLTASTLPWGDVTLVYSAWIENGLNGYWVGIDGPWVYPLLALVPMIAAMGLGPSLYGIGWLFLVVIANGAVLAFILNSRATAEPSAEVSAADRVGFTPNIRFVAAWWWLGFLLLLGPVALGRIDTFEVDLVIVGLLLAIRRPAISGGLLALAMWVKVWPAALIVAVVIAVKRRAVVAIGAAVTAIGVAIVGLLLGAGANLFSFVTQQTGRGLQVEAPISLPWMWMAYFRLPNSRVYYDDDILTFQVKGNGGPVADFLTTPLLAIAVVCVLALGIWVVRSGASATRVLPSLSLALVTALIVFNKVGSPQFMLWISAPIILGLIWQGREFKRFAIIAAVLGALTQLIYPYLYDWLLSLDPFMLTVLTVRNLLVIVLFALAVRSVFRARVRSKSIEFAPSEKVAI
ncbi:glycosyltransferase 87 family protein [Subtercola endophyticus]|uniref:glycosyltransferase 87 family protein n=1 Tax=Subtercola endophyticus TaxID=2895559 RepID=UPI001E2FB283|nr:glycosyltransferase 87 family protein [Subtercola endophyticus]UFS60008.1 glycosyltransferase 87 family protein [Subtercola endophyticus]